MATQPPKSGHRRIAFVVGCSGHPVQQVVRALQLSGLDVEVDAIDEVDRDPLTILDRLSLSDIVVAVDEGRGSIADLYTEIGAAMGARKPVLLVAKSDPTASDPHPILLAIPTVVIPELSAAAIRIAIREFLKRLRMESVPHRSESKFGALSPDVIDHFLSRYSELAHSASEAQLVDFVKDVLGVTGTVVAGHAGEKGVDLVGLPAGGDRPIVIEIKKGRPRSTAVARRSAERIASYAARKRAAGALLIWIGSEGGSAAAEQSARRWLEVPGVRVYELADFVRALGSQSLLDLCARST